MGAPFTNQAALIPLLLALVLLPACHSSSSSGGADGGTDADTDADTDTASDTGDETCVPGETEIEFYLDSFGGLEFVPGRDYQLDDGVLTVTHWGETLCSAVLDDDQLDELLSSALAIDLNGLEESYPVAVDGFCYGLILDLPPCTYETMWGIDSEIEYVPAPLNDFAEVVESVGDPLAEDCPDAGPDGGE
jgi:hypothetical protein